MCSKASTALEQNSCRWAMVIACWLRLALNRLDRGPARRCCLVYMLKWSCEWLFSSLHLSMTQPSHYYFWTLVRIHSFSLKKSTNSHLLYSGEWQYLRPSKQSFSCIPSAWWVLLPRRNSGRWHSCALSELQLASAFNWFPRVWDCFQKGTVEWASEIVLYM